MNPDEEPIGEVEADPTDVQEQRLAVPNDDEYDYAEPEADPAARSSAEDLDEDRLDADPLEEGADAAERWSVAEEYGTTPREQQEGEDIDRKLRAERPDVD